MQVKTAVVWWLVKSEDHPALEESDKTIKALMPLIDTLFPGINYYSVTGFNQVMQECVIPALRHQHPALRTTATREVRSNDMTEVTEVLRSAGYEWQDSDRWRARFRRLIAD